MLSMSDGQITGTPTVATVAANFTVTVTDANGATASNAFKVAYPWLHSATVALSPFVGIYADYYFTGDSAAVAALAGAVPLASTPLLDGWSARATGGVSARFASGPALAFGAELGGIGSHVQIWTYKGRASLPFSAQ